MNVYRDIPYTLEPSQNSLHKFDLYLPLSLARTPAAGPLICFVHGGAWRSEDKRDHTVLAQRLVRHTGYPVAVPNYRLTLHEEKEDDILRHPSHAEDVLQFLEFLLTWEGPPRLGTVFNPNKLLLMAHSCGAHMLASILLNSSAVTPTLIPSPALLDAVKGVVMSEGIYDLDLLVEHFPDYLDWFIAPAFGKLDSYAAFAMATHAPRRSDIKWLLIHSQGDTLVNFPQSEKMLQHLQAEYGPSANKCISYNTSLTQGHDDILVTDDFVQIVGRFIEGSLASPNM